MDRLIQSFERQAAACRELGSPFMGALLDRAIVALEGDGPVSRLVRGWDGPPAAGAISLRFAAAVHAMVRSGRAPELAALYPAPGREVDVAPLWELIEAAVERNRDWAEAFIQSPPQTNEVARAGALACGFLKIAENAPQPFHLLELGASAGLNLHWDQFAYTHPPWKRARERGPVIPTVMEGDAPAWRPIVVSSRRGCDQAPLDPVKPDHRLRLASYVWPDQFARLERLDAALTLAAGRKERVERGDAAAWLEARLGEGLERGVTVVYHSVFLQYPPKEIRERIAAALDEAGARATSERQLARLMFEPAAMTGRDGDAFLLTLRTWPDGDDRVLAQVDPHGRNLAWLASSH